SNILSQVVTARRSGSFVPAPASVPATAISAFSQVIGDFNGDGIPDLATSPLDGGMQVILGNGDGSFRRTYYDMNTIGDPLAVADFNDDGKLDLLGSKLYLGNGDGTFQSGIALPASPIRSLPGGRVVVGDFNRDGKADVAMSGQNSDVIVMLGNGNG